MKIISLPTIYTPAIGNQQVGNITLFFEFSDEQYNRLVNTDFDDIWQVLDALLAWSEDHWNLDVYMDNNRLKPHSSAYEHTTQTDILFFPI